MAEIRCFDYVNHPYARVRDALREDAEALFREATKAASTRAESVASELRVNLGALEVSADIKISVLEVAEQASEASSPPSTRLRLEWEAARSPRLFPFMSAVLSVYPLTATETQLDFTGEYEPPLGALGSAVNKLVGHRLAEASVHRFLKDVAEHLRATLSRTSST